VVVISPHTSHGLAACDQFNQLIHQRRRHHQAALLDAGIVNLTESMRMEALAKALKDISERYNEASIAWERVGIKQSSRDVSFMANTPRNHEMPNLPSEAAVTQDVAIPTPPAADASKAELLVYAEKLKAALAQRQEEVISLSQVISPTRRCYLRYYAEC